MLKDEISGLINLTYHRAMLTDATRMRFFKKAIARIVEPGMNVVDLGAGTGILSYLAVKAGATVTAVEYDEINYRSLVRNIARNGLEHRVLPVRADAMTYLCDAPADALLCEMCHAGLMVERQVPVVESFMRRHLDRFGSAPAPIPCQAVLGFDLVEKKYTSEGFESRSVHYEDAYDRLEITRAARCEPQIYHVVDFRECIVRPATYEQRGQFRVSSEGTANTVRLHLFIALAGATVSADDSWNLSNLNFPLDRDLELSIGDTLRYSLSYEPGGPLGSFGFSLDTGTGVQARSIL